MGENDVGNGDKNDKLLNEKDNLENNQIQTRNQQNPGRILPQVLCTVAAAFGSLSVGFVNGWSANALTSISDDPDFELDSFATSFIAGIIGLGALIGGICNGKILDLLGRKRTIMAVSPIMAIGWIMIGIAPNLIIIYIGRFLTGFSLGFLQSAVQIYSSETCHTSIRGRVGSLPAFCLTLGLLSTYIMTARFTWRTSAYIGAGFAAIPFVTMLFVPESPYWMLMKNKKKETEKIIRKLRGPNYDIDDEIKDMNNKLTSVGKKVSYKELLKPRTRYPLMVAFLMMFVQQVMGVNIIVRYTGTILRQANSSIDSNIGTVYTGIAQVTGFFISLFFIDKLERKTLMMTSMTLVALMQVILGCYFLSMQVYDFPWPGWIPTVILICLVLSFCLGARSIPWVIASEVFNTSIRSRANSVCLIFNKFLGLIIVQMFPFFNASAGTYSVFLVHAALGFICIVLVKVFIPKMKGKTLEDIQEYFELKVLANKKNTKKDCEASI